MPDGIFGNRERALENAYIREHDAKLLDRLRRQAHLDEIAEALAEMLQVDDPGLLLKVTNLGIEPDTAAALFLAPLVQVAWADGTVSRQSREAVLHKARERGIEEASAAYAQLQALLETRPPQAFFAIGIEVLRAGFGVLPPREREERVKALLKACLEVADPPAVIEHIVGRSDGISHAESKTIDEIERALRG